MTAKVDLFKRHQDLKQSYPALSEIHKNKQSESGFDEVMKKNTFKKKKKVGCFFQSGYINKNTLTMIQTGLNRLHFL